MKKYLITGLLLIVFPFSVFCQKVDSIKVEQTGDLIKIHYKILNSNQFQTFRVTLFCSINGGLESVPKSLSGDFGENVPGGRGDYLILWDVLKDVDEVKSVDFSVRAELAKDETPKSSHAQFKLTDPQKYWSRERFYVLLTGAAGSGCFLAGGRLAYMGSWGFSLSMLSGKKKYSSTYDGKTEYNSNLNQIDLSIRIFNKKSDQIHIIAGIALGDNEGIGNLQTVFGWGYDVGVVAGLGRTALYAGFSSLLSPLATERDFNNISYFDLGVGIRF